MTTDLKTVALTILEIFGKDLHLGDLPHCIVIVGPPASAKTTMLDFIKGLPSGQPGDDGTWTPPRGDRLGSW